MTFFPLADLPAPILQRIARRLERWDRPAAREACSALRAAANSHAQRLVITPHSLSLEESADKYCVKSRPTDFHLFPGVRSITLVPCEDIFGMRTLVGTFRPEGAGREPPHPLRVAAAFTLPTAPAAAAAARAALAGVTRLEVGRGGWHGGNDFLDDASRAAAALPLLPGLRAAALRCKCVRSAADDGEMLSAALGGCPQLESLEWDVQQEEYFAGDDRIFSPSFQALSAYLPRLTELRTHIRDEAEAELQGFTGLRRLALRLVDSSCEGGNWGKMQGLSALTSLESLELTGDFKFLSFHSSDLAPLSALTRLRLQAAPRDLPSCPAGSRLLRLELSDFGGDQPPARLLAALARGAPCLDRLRIDDLDYKEQLGGLLGADVTWPRLTHLQSLAVLPRLTHLCFGLDDWEEGLASYETGIMSGAPYDPPKPPPPPPDVAALHLARCPRLRVLEVGREGSPLWSHAPAPPC
ncbi:MAG: hypothetical protein J3K34DRAFT_516207 [Monoraphidium minutum]|nr:MAG: hypothetical protein J3K34DRAFT_516207 [Monoraphidium minutum]